ncbi:cell division protein FtsZ [Candidatus Nomurabacteria bacterium RIFCSPLOWO2_01_FULL_36_10b]|uniref:Cell division protein FtsZ n=1 Tax=Candidatus Nomurabacteria bacterium RIFCSPLOWO2_01_FULL_36_10b TaxID=1801766 RepID=A0A1F6WNR4_9BACT|nr:MAG: cell division protein FtsZ [Candidatus Nomurabacteria bacterium RIFCSPLOWO2_01_FULL_36_10b]
MPNVKPRDIKPFARIKVIGIGGSGKNAVNHMMSKKIDGVEYICMNTDVQDLHNAKSEMKVHLGRNLTKGRGSGMNPDIGRQSAEETKAEIQEALKGADMIFIAGGMGGGTCTGASPVVARLAKEEGVLTVGVVTRPFFFEGHQRLQVADQGIKELEKEVDALVVIPNDRLLAITGEDTSFREAFAMCDDVLLQAVKGISELITKQGMINIDYADIQTILADAGTAFMGIGVATGQNRAHEAALAAINSPLLDIAIDGAKGVLFAISGGEDLKMQEVHQAAKIITESIDPHAKVIFGAIEDDTLKKGELKVTVIATGFSGATIKKKETPLVSTISSPRKDKDSDNLEESTSIPFSTITSKDSNKFDEDFSDDNIDDKSIDTLEDSDEDWSAIPAFLRRSKK